jgi:exonuclease III
VYRDGITIKQVKTSTFNSFECLQVLLVLSETINLAIIYRPPPSKANRLTDKQFYEEFAVFLGNNVEANNFVVVGDLNIHWDNREDKTKQLSDILEDIGLTMYVSSATHRWGAYMYTGLHYF